MEKEKTQISLTLAENESVIQPFDLKAKGTTVKYDGKAQTVKL